uniref:AP complex mu/sigma subunit domain-containing protein n=1 Tax=Oryza meridionalis TaxID=40149 RepID=A0A0E0D8L8_9ORYZ
MGTNIKKEKKISSLLAGEIVSTAGEPSKPELTSATAVARHDKRIPYDIAIHFVLLISRQGKVRLTKWYNPYPQKERSKVCELDLIFNFHKAYFILDEVLIAGELQESNKKAVLRLITTQDNLVEAAKEEASSLRNIIAQATK